MNAIDLYYQIPAPLHIDAHLIPSGCVSMLTYDELQEVAAYEE